MKKCTKTNKRVHDSVKAALIARKKMRNSLLNAYQCGHCKGFHLGRSNDPVRSANRISEVLAQHERALRKRLQNRDDVSN